MKRIIMLAVLTLAISTTASAQLIPQVTAVWPVHNDMDVSVSADVGITFNISMLAPSLNDTTIIVTGSLSGYHTGSVSWNRWIRTAYFIPDIDFAEGEVVYVLVTTGVQSPLGYNMLENYAFNFTVEGGNGSGIFISGSDCTLGHYSYSMTAADFDRDGDIDLATANYHGGISVGFNNGDATFGSFASASAGNGPIGIFAADFNGDGYTDLVTANKDSDDIGVVLNNGDGTFSLDAIYAAGNTPWAVCAADLDEDGDQDVMAVNGFGNNVSVFLNNGDGTMAADVLYSTGGQPEAICAADLDGDRDIDFATANRYSMNVHVHMNNGDGTFEPSTYYSTYDFSSGPQGILAADLDADGDLDLAVAHQVSHDVVIMLNNGDGTYVVDNDYTVAYPANGICAGDFDGDGDIDLATADYLQGDRVARVTVLPNNGDGTFGYYKAYRVGDRPSGIIAADLDEDGDMDLASSNVYDSNVSVLLNADGFYESIAITATGVDIPFIAEDDTLAIFNFMSEELDYLEIRVYMDALPPHMPYGTDWVRRYYEITPYPWGAAFEADMELFYAQEEFDSSGLPDESLLHMYRYDRTVPEWEVQLGILDTARNSISCSGVTEFSIWAFTSSSSIVGDEPGQAPAATALYQNYPNPFNPATQIKYVLHRDSDVNLAVYDVLGRKVVTLVDGKQTTGYRTVTWNGRDGSGNQMASGVYFYRLIADDFVQTRKMILLR